MQATSPVRSRRRSAVQSVSSNNNNGNSNTGSARGSTFHVNPPRPPRPSRDSFQLPSSSSHTTRSSVTAPTPRVAVAAAARPIAAEKKAELEAKQRQQNAMVAPGLGTDIPQLVVVPRKSQTRDRDGGDVATDALDSMNTESRYRNNADIATDAAAAREDKPVIDTSRLSRKEQEEIRMREVARLNQLEEAKAQARAAQSAVEVAAAAASARQQLGQPEFVAITARQAIASSHYDEAHDYEHLVKDLHTRLGVVPASLTEQEKQSQKQELVPLDHVQRDTLTKSTKKKRKSALPKPMEMVGDVHDRVVALRRAEMAQMVALLRRLLAEGKVTRNPQELPILPAAIMGSDAGTSSPACNFCIEMKTEDVIKEHFVPVLRALMSARVAVPVPGRRGSASVVSNVASESATTLDAFREHSSRSSRKLPDALTAAAAPANENTTDDAEKATWIVHGGEDEDVLTDTPAPAPPTAAATTARSSSSRYTTPRCFRIEIVPFGLDTASLHITVHPNLAEAFYMAHARQQEHLFSLAIDPPYPARWSDWTDADRQRLLHRVLDDLLRGGPNPPITSPTENISLFPAHVDATRDALWNSVWKARSLSRFLTIPEEPIAAYFGPEVMFYYAWMNHYARWLLGAGLCGVAVSFLSSVQFVDADSAAQNATMSSDSRSAFAAVNWRARRAMQSFLDVLLLPSFTLIMIVGSVVCIKTWERRCSTLTMQYRLLQQETKDEPRRDFRGKPGRNPVTGEPELRYPAWYRAMILQPFAWLVVLLFMLVTVFMMICSLNLDGMVVDPRSRLAVPFLRHHTLNGGILDPAVHPLFALLPPLGYSVCIAGMNFIFTELAELLTRMENYRYRGEYVRALTLKRVAFEFVNSYAKLIFIAFGRASMPDLVSNLRSILYVAVLSRLMSDTVLPFFVTHRRRVARRLLEQQHEGQEHKKRTQTKAGAKEKSAATAHSSKVTELTAAATEKGNSAHANAPVGATAPARAPPPATSSPAAVRHGGNGDSSLDEVDEMLQPYDVYMDFIEMIMQFGYILLFAAAYPLASFVALVSNMIEVRSDLFKMCYVVRRPVPRLGLQENATWCGVMRVFAIAAVITNTFLLAFTSHQMARWFPEYFSTNTSSLDTNLAVPYGSTHDPGFVHVASSRTASWASLANRADTAHVSIDIKPGRGQQIMFYSMLMEHAMGLVAVFLFWRIPSTPRNVRHYLERRMHERMSRA